MKIMLNYLEIETCNLCNMRCTWCPFGQLPSFRGDKAQFLDTVYIEKIFIELKKNNFNGVISFYSMNEPLLDERITNGSLFSLCRKILSYSDVKIRINTNGVLLSYENIEEMLNSGLEKIFVSCYDSNMLEKIKKLQKRYEEIEILDFTNENVKLLKFNRAGSIKPYEEFTVADKKSCYFPIYSAVIGFDGEIRICFNDALGQIKLGNIKNEGFYDVLNSKETSKLRNKILTNREDVFPCNMCNFEEMPDHRFDFIRPLTSSRSQGGK